MSEAPESPYLTARQAAAYLHINEKKLYALAGAREVPAARVGGKWLFPRALIDEWLQEQAHAGLLTDRLLVGGADDPLLQAAMQDLGARLGSAALIAHVPSNTPSGLAQLSQRRLDVSAFHWGLAADSAQQHPVLLRRQRNHGEWTVLRLGWREQGVMLRPGLGVSDLHTLVGFDYRWALQAGGSGSRYFLQLALEQAGFRLDDCTAVAQAMSARAAAALVARGVVDCAPGARALAREHGLDFIPLGAECLDLALPRAVFFRHLFQALLETLASPALAAEAAALGGYDLSPLGKVLAIDAPACAGALP